ncbi:MAG: PLP-dependent transferase [Chloroflexota bacterium]
MRFQALAERVKGGVVTFTIDGDSKDTERFLDALTLPDLAVSLGGVESLIGQPAVMTYYDIDSEDREAMLIPDNLILFAVGLEDDDDRAANLEQALDAI